MSTITTFTGENFDPLNPNVQQINIEDIAHALSLMCRANGHIIRFFSVAQHALNCSVEAAGRGYSQKVQLACLLHDASEAYLSDITRPIKRHLPAYVQAEKKLQDIIYDKFLQSPLSEEEYAQVQGVDDDMLEAEFVALMPVRVAKRSVQLHTSPSYAFCSFDAVESEFIMAFNRLRE